jgi:ribosomal protein S27E
MKCPGQDMKYWKASAIFDANCPKCGSTVEFYKDDTSRKCPKCGHRFVNPQMDFGCASYCQYAEQCLGALPEEFTGSRDNLLKDKVAVEMKRYFQTDFRRIRQATTAARFAETIGKAEGGNLAVILCAAYLHDTGQEGAEAILKKVGANPSMIEEICQLLEPRARTGEGEALPAKILHDALTLKDLYEEIKESRINGATAQQLGEERLLTSAAKGLAATLAG